ncbi:radical SAM protein [Candidatus Woesearchaeota archaeon CG_4_10_14_0_2_um_filter_33_13]|nr:MAG: radical SAM protein [Candidatus Woesearchaeota archaeon CG_4_10_14_0_2_um_filter_33_13]
MQKGDFSGSGIPYMPITMAYAASYLKEKGYDIKVIDSFGNNPVQIISKNNFYYQGQTPEQIVNLVYDDTEAILIFAERLVAHSSLVEIIKNITSRFSCPVVLVENSQAVTSYSLLKLNGELSSYGVKGIVLNGDGKRIENMLRILKSPNNLKDDMDGLILFGENNLIRPIKDYFENLDSYPFPAWDLFNLKHYWNLGYSHAPLSSKKYLPLLTSRGCPLKCKFCVTPGLNNGVWRKRSAKNVVDEIEFSIKRYGVKEFHLEDLNPTVDKKRMVEISQEIIKRNLNISWKIGSGTKVETLDENTIINMAKAGCSYISISPESGSKRVLDLMNKYFKHDYALKMVRSMRKNNITVQACFVLGFPGETEEDLAKTKQYIHKLVKAGVCEIALFIITPAPGSMLFKSDFKGYGSISQLTFTPSWRKDFDYLTKKRRELYMSFFWWNLFYNPSNLIRILRGLVTRNFYTKIDMTLYRYFKIKRLLWGSKNHD